jgi:hypothetical protein
VSRITASANVTPSCYGTKAMTLPPLEIALATTKHLLAEVRREPVECPHKGGAKTNNLFSRAGTTQAPFAAVDASLLNLEHDIAHRARSI